MISRSSGEVIETKGQKALRRMSEIEQRSLRATLVLSSARVEKGSPGPVFSFSSIKTTYHVSKPR
jgi:hypothetical protein